MTIPTERLPVAAHAELDFPGLGSSGPQLFGDALAVGSRPVPEEGERDVQVFARHDSARAELCRLPFGKAVERVVAQLQRAEEPESVTTGDATGRRALLRHASVTSLRTRCNAATVARVRIV